MPVPATPRETEPEIDWMHGLARCAVGLFLTTLVPACGALTDPNAPPWTQISTAGATARWGQTAQLDARRDRMLAFGGENQHGQLSELLILKLDTLTWERVDTRAWLSPRTDLASAIDAVRDRLVLIGGRQGLATSIGEVWALDLATNVWAELPRGPAPRHDVVAASDGAHAWVFGGAGEFLQSLDDLWELDFATDSWRQLPEPLVRPPARGSNALVYFDGALYLVGGHDVWSVQRDVWRYDLAAEAWSPVAFESGSPAWAHFGFAVDPVCGRLVLEAGDNLDNQDTSLGSMLTLGTPAHFSLLPTSTLPPPRDHPSMILDASRRRLVLFGGGRLGDGLGTLGDAWTYTLPPCP